MSDPALEAFKARLPLAEVVGRYVRLTRRGREWVGLCPFHREKTPSFTVVEEKGFFHCFGCGAHGNAIDFLMRVEGLDFPRALERAAELTGIPLPPRERRAERPRPDVRLYEANAAALAWFRARLQGPEGEGARRYLDGRGVDAATAETFALGYAPPDGDGLARALGARGFPAALLETAGLVVRRGDRLRDRFRDRLIFPIHDRRGRVVGFGGRALGHHPAKYLNTPETPLFRKGELLFNLHRAVRPARERGRLFLVEGYMDVVALHRAGFAEAVAPLGTALGPAQLAEAWRLADEPVLCFDGDAAGRRAAWRAALRALPLLRPGRSLRFLFLPEGEDPDSLIRGRGPKAFAELATEGLPLVEVLWRFELEAADPTTPERRAALRRRVGELVRKIADPAVRAAYAAELHGRLEGLFPLRRRGRRGRAGAPVRPLARPASPRRLAREVAGLARDVELHFLARLVAEPGLLAAHEEAVAELELDDPECERLRQELLHWYAEGGDLDPTRLRDHLTRHGFGRLLERMPHASSPTPDASAGEEALGEWREMLQRLGRRAARRRELLHVTELLRRGGNDPAATGGVPSADDRDEP